MARNAIPGPPAPPFFGPLVPFMRDPLHFMLQNYRDYGDVVRINMLGLKGAALHGAEANRYILVDNVENFLVEPLIDKVRARWIVGQGVLFIDDPRHKQQRKLMQPAFHRKRVEEYQLAMQRTAKELLDRWKPGVELDIAREMHHLALSVVGRTLFSMELEGASHELGEAVATIVYSLSQPIALGMSQLPFNIPGGGRGADLRRALKRVDRVLQEVAAQHEQSGVDTGDVVSMLVSARDEEGNGLTREQVRDQLLTLFVAGHETSANALAWTFYLLAQHPRVATKLLEEIERELKGEAPDAAALERLPYLDMVVKEALRLYPPAASANRTAKEGFEWKGYYLPAGSLISYVPFVSHRIPEQFPEPETFRPERFDPQGPEKAPPYAYIPFAAGPRSCIGAPFATMEIKTVAAMALQRFRLDLVPDQIVQATVRTTVQPRYGIRMRPEVQDANTERSPARVFGNVVGSEPVQR